MMAAAKTIAIALLALVSIFGAVFAGSITGTLNDAATGNPVAGATVYAYDADNVLISQAQSSAAGVFTITGVSGPHTLYIVRAGYSNGYFTAEVGDAENLNLGALQLVPNSQVSFTVKNTSGQQVSGCVVKAIQTTGEVVGAVSGCSGTLQLSPGDYDITFEAPFYVSKSVPVSLGMGESTALSPVLDSSPINTMPTVVSVTVQASDTTPTAGDEVILSAAAHYNDGHDEDVTMSATWSHGNAGALYLPVLVVNSSGAHTVTATFLGVSGSVQLSVAPGAPVALDLTASKTSVTTKQQVTLAPALQDAYGNRWATSDVAYTTTCGTISGNTFTAPSSACTAHITAVYAPDHSLNDTIAISVTAQDEEKDRDRDTRPKANATSNTTSTAPSTPSVPAKPPSNATTGTSTIKVVLPASGYVGDEVTVTVLDTNSDPLKGIVLTLVWPDGTKVSLVTGKGGEAKFTPHVKGKYKVASTKYAIVGDTVFEALEKPEPAPTNASNKPIVPGGSGAGDSGSGTAPTGPDRGILGSIFAAFAGEISAADAIRATMPLWLVVGGIILAAALFFVVYTFLAGKLPDPDDGVQAAEPQKEVVVAAKPEAPSEKPKPADEISIMESEVDELKRELEEKMQRLKRAKEGHK
ncbi:MAG: carboxypeptidase regulatory-like domain-containing protein [Candidatus Micrarchaeota archaeon]|nr:carboxypeptidase regulatory-like domain-containing protein [Candidatus Micrarchaeota archaeon]